MAGRFFLPIQGFGACPSEACVVPLYVDRFGAGWHLVVALMGIGKTKLTIKTDIMLYDPDQRVMWASNRGLDRDVLPFTGLTFVVTIGGNE